MSSAAEGIAEAAHAGVAVASVPTEPSPELAAEYFRLLFQDSGAALIAAGPDLLIRACNYSASRLFGAAEVTLVGTPVLQLVPHERREAAADAVHRAISRGEVSEFEITDRDAAGVARELAVTISPIADHQGRRIGVSAAVRDITKRIRLAEELARSRKMASLGQLAGGLAHHMNNILGGVITSVDFALSSDNAAKHRKVLEQTATELARATRLMRDLLAFAEGDQRTMDLGDLTEAILEVASQVEPDLVKARIQLQLDLGQIPIVPVRKAAFEHALLNLIHNAIEAMPDGGALTIRTRPAGPNVLVDIADTGVGMAPEHLEHAFEPFYSTKQGGHLESSTLRGLGLAVVHGIVQFMGGSVRVESTAGHGTLFRLSLPIARKADNSN